MREGESSLYKEIDIDDLDNQGSIEGNDTSDSRGSQNSYTNDNENIGEGERGSDRLSNSTTENPLEKTMETVQSDSHTKGGARREGGRVKIRLLNVQGLSEIKHFILVNEFLKKEEEYNILCLTETQQRVNTIEVKEDLYSFTSMRRGEVGRGFTDTGEGG